MADSTRSLGRKVLSGTAWATAGRLVLLPSGLVVSALLVRILDPAEVGAYFLALNVVVMGAMLANGGVEEAVLQQLPQYAGTGDRDAARGTLGRSILLVAASALVVAVLYFLWGHGLVYPRLVDRGAVGHLALPLTLWLVAMSLQRLVGEAYRGLNRISDSVMLGGITQFGGVLASLLLIAALGVVLLRVGHLSLRGVFFLTAASVGVASLFGVGRLLWREASFRVPSHVGTGVAQLILTGLPLLVSNITQYLSKRADIWVVGILGNDAVTGLYATVATLPVLVNAPLTVANLALAPAIGELHARGDRGELHRLVGLSGGMALLPALVLAGVFLVAGGPVLHLLFGDYYRQGALILVILSLGQVVSVAVGSSGWVLLMSGHHMDLMWCSVVGAAVTVAGTLVGGSVGGATGIAVGAALGAATQQLSKLVMARVRLGLWTHARPVAALKVILQHVRQRSRGAGSGKPGDGAP